MITSEMIAAITSKISELIADKGYYDGSRLLRKAAGDKPSTILISTTTRSTGKTSYYILFSWFLNRWYGKETAYMVRLVNDLKNYHVIFYDVLEYYELLDGEFKSELIVRDTVAGITYNAERFGYVICLKKADALKKFSSVFRDVELVLMEEYQPEEQGGILKNEPDKLKSILRTVGRGNGRMTREVLTVLLGNPVTLLNPYLIKYKIAPQYHAKDGIITVSRVSAEFNLLNAASEEMKEHSLTEIYCTDYDIGKSFLYASDGFVRKAPGKCSYMFTIVYGKDAIGIRGAKGKLDVYCTPNPDPKCDLIFALNPSDMDETRTLINRRSFTWQYLRDAFNSGHLFFATLKIKEVMFDLLGISVYN